MTHAFRLPPRPRSRCQHTQIPHHISFSPLKDITRIIAATLNRRRRRRRLSRPVGRRILAEVPADRLHGERTRGRCIQNAQFLGREVFGQQERPHRHEQQDDDGEANGGDGLRDGEGSGEAEKLEGDEIIDGAFATDACERFGGGRGEGVVAEEEEAFFRDAVLEQGLDAHDEEEAGEDTLRDEVQDDEERAGHGAEGEEALSEVGDALFDDVVNDAAGVAFVCFVGVGRFAGDAKRFGVEGCLRDEAVGEGDAEEPADAGGQAQEEDVPVEAGGFAEREFGALGD